MSTSDIIEYKNYLAKLTLDTEDNIIVGRVINTADIISFHGRTVKEAKIAFHNVLDTYLATCKEKKIEPSLPCSGKFSLRVDPLLHRRLRDYAKLENMSLNELIIHLLERDLMQTLEFEEGKSPRHSLESFNTASIIRGRRQASKSA